MNCKTIYIDTGRQNTTAPIYAKQGDCKSRYIKIAFLCNGSPFDIPKGSTAVFNVCRSDGSKKSFFAEIKPDVNIIIAEINSWILAIPGSVKCDASIICGDKKLTSSTFQITVDDAVAMDTTIQESENYDVLIDLINDCNKAVNDANSATNRANQAAEAIENITAADIKFNIANTNAINSNNVQGAIDEIVNKVGSIVAHEYNIDDWQDVYNILKLGLGKQVFNVGDILYCYSPILGVNKIALRIIGINEETPVNSDIKHTLTLQTVKCIKSMQFDAAEPDNPDTIIAENGNANYQYSALKQWLNSYEEAGDWWEQQGDYDQPPSNLNSINGFLFDIDGDLEEHICEVYKTTRNLNGSYDVTVEKVFILSQSEIYGGTSNGEEGAPYSYYQLKSSLEAPGMGSDANRRGILPSSSTPSNNVFQWLRTLSHDGIHRVITYYSGSIADSIALPKHPSYVTPVFCIGA